jgi:hypothetical protein
MPVALDRFTAAVNELSRLRTEGHLRAEVTPQGFVSLVFDEEGRPQAPEGGDGLYVDIQDVMTAIAAGVIADEFVRVRETGRGGLEPEDPTVARAKYELVSADLADGLQRRAWLRTTSKVFVLTSYEWEVVSKLADSSSRPRPAEAAEYVYGLLRLNSQRGTEEGQPDQRVTVIGLDTEDLDKLIRGLSDLRVALGAETARTVQEGTGTPNE